MELKIIDWELGIKFAQTKAGAEEMLILLAKSLREKMPEMEQAYQENNHQKLYDITHFLHGGAAYCGAPRLKQALYDLETSLKQNTNLEFKKFYTRAIKEANNVLENIPTTTHE